LYKRMKSPPTSNKNQNNSIFHATFLDGFRGVAALCVVYAHTQIYNQRLAFRTFDIFGYYGVITFFVLSAFLLTFRTLLDWERYHEKREEKKDTNSVVVNRIDHLESGVDLETNLSIIPLLSSTDSDNTIGISSIEEIEEKKPDNAFYSYIRKKILPKCQIPVKFWSKFFLRRFMRVYPPYAILLLFIAYNGFLRNAYNNFMDSSTLTSHLFFITDNNSIFWTIPIELMYYLCIPIIVIGYVELACFGAFLTNYYFKKPAIGTWICRILVNVIIVTKRTELLIAHSEDRKEFYKSSFLEIVHIFLVGSICAIWYREIIRLGLLPLSLEEENSLADKSNDYNISTLIRSRFVKLIISKLPSRHQFARYFFDFGCYFLLLLKFCTLPHISEKVFGLSRTSEMVLERKLGGSLDAILIFFALLSRNGSFVNAFSCDFLRFCGKISFSIYLLHPIAMTFVNEYVTSIGYKAADKESNEDEKANVILDAVMLSFVTTFILAWFYFKCIERPSMNLANYIAKRWLSE
ncbi:20717_t:CDS:2, partial [Dentiscutata erythropus]